MQCQLAGCAQQSHEHTSALCHPICTPVYSLSQRLPAQRASQSDRAVSFWTQINSVCSLLLNKIVYGTWKTCHKVQLLIPRKPQNDADSSYPHAAGHLYAEEYKYDWESLPSAYQNRVSTLKLKDSETLGPGQTLSQNQNELFKLGQDHTCRVHCQSDWLQGPHRHQRQPYSDWPGDDTWKLKVGTGNILEAFAEQSKPKNNIS